MNNNKSFLKKSTDVKVSVNNLNSQFSNNSTTRRPFKNGVLKGIIIKNKKINQKLNLKNAPKIFANSNKKCTFLNDSTKAKSTRQPIKKYERKIHLSINSSSTQSTNFSKNDDDAKFVELSKKSKKFLLAQEKWRKDFLATVIQAVYRGYYYRNYIFKTRKTILEEERQKSNLKLFPGYKKSEMKNDFFDKMITDSFSCSKKSDKSKIKEIMISFSKKNGI